MLFCKPCCSPCHPDNVAMLVWYPPFQIPQSSASISESVVLTMPQAVLVHHTSFPHKSLHHYIGHRNLWLEPAPVVFAVACCCFSPRNSSILPMSIHDMALAVADRHSEWHQSDLHYHLPVVIHKSRIIEQQVSVESKVNPLLWIVLSNTGRIHFLVDEHHCHIHAVIGK